MKAETSNAIGNAAIGGSSVTGLFSIVSQYYSEIMVLLTAIGLLIGWYYKHKSDKYKYNADRRAEEYLDMERRAREYADLEKKKMALKENNDQG